MNRFRALNGLLVPLVLAALAGCGGGGGGGGGATSLGKAWGTAAPVESQAANIYDGSAVIGFDDAGNLLMVYLRNDLTRRAARARRLDAVTMTWSTSVPIETGAGSVGFDSAALAVNAAGNAAAVWTQDGDASAAERHDIWVSRYLAAGNAWQAAELIETDDTGQAFSPQVAIDPAGNIVVVWHQDGDPSANTRFDIWARRFDTSAGTWAAAQLLETDAGPARAPRVSIDVNGNAIAVWQQDVGATTYIRANRFAAGTWGSAQNIGSFSQGAGGNPRIAMDASGNAMAVWEEYLNATNEYNIAANRYDAVAQTWGTAQAIATGAAGVQPTSNPRIAMDPAGNAIVVWEFVDGVSSLAAARFAAATGSWSAAVSIETDTVGNTQQASIAMDAAGNALVVWRSSDGVMTNVWSNRYAAGQGWGSAALIEAVNSGDANSPQVAARANGDAVAVWSQDDDAAPSASIWFNRYR